MLNRMGFFVLSSALAVTGCGQQPQPHTTNPQYQTQNAPINPANPNIDCSPIVNPNYVPGGNQAQYYYPEGCQTNANNMGYNNGYNNGYNYNNGSNIGGYVGAAAVGAAAGALANRAYNQRNQNRTTITSPNTPQVTPKPSTNNPRYNTNANNRTYTPTYNRNSTVYRKGTVNNRATSRSSSRRR